MSISGRITSWPSRPDGKGSRWVLKPSHVTDYNAPCRAPPDVQPNGQLKKWWCQRFCFPPRLGETFPITCYLVFFLKQECPALSAEPPASKTGELISWTLLRAASLETIPPEMNAVGVCATARTSCVWNWKGLVRTHWCTALPSFTGSRWNWYTIPSEVPTTRLSSACTKKQGSPRLGRKWLHDQCRPKWLSVCVCKTSGEDGENRQAFENVIPATSAEPT